MMLLSATYKNHINNILNIIKGFEASGYDSRQNYYYR